MLAARRWALLFTSLFVLLAAGAAYVAAARVQQLQREAGDFTDIVVAARAIDAHTPIVAADLAVERLPRRYLRAGLLTDPAASVGRASSVALQPGELLLEPMLRRPAGADPLRAYTLTSSAAVVIEPGIQPGDHLDILAAIHDKDGDRTSLLLAGVTVIRTQTDLRSRSVTLALSLDQAQALMYAEDFGRQVRLLRRET